MTRTTRPLPSHVEAGDTMIPWTFPPHGHLLMNLRPGAGAKSVTMDSPTETKWTEIARLSDPVPVHALRAKRPAAGPGPPGGLALKPSGSRSKKSCDSKPSRANSSSFRCARGASRNPGPTPSPRPSSRKLQCGSRSERSTRQRAVARARRATRSHPTRRTRRAEQRHRLVGRRIDPNRNAAADSAGEHELILTIPLRARRMSSGAISSVISA